MFFAWFSNLLDVMRETTDWQWSDSTMDVVCSIGRQTSFEALLSRIARFEGRDRAK